MAKAPATQSMGELLDLIPRRRLFPGEDPAAYADLRQALLNDLFPATPYETAIAENLVELEWEAHRYRQLRDNLLRERFREFAVGAFCEGKITRPLFPSLEAEDRTLALLGADQKARDQSIQILADKGIDEGAILAEAYAAERQALASIERHIAEIETRRRRLHEDFDRLKSRRPRAIPDAELVEDDGQ